MKIIDQNATPATAPKTSGLGRAIGGLKLPFAPKSPPAQDLVVGSLHKMLDNRYFLFRNATLEGSGGASPDISIPLILVGPSGLYVICPSDVKGVFQARDAAWEELDNVTRRFKVSKPNLIARATLMAKAVESYLTTQAVPFPTIEPVLYFSNPGVHVDSSRPAARVVLADALDRFVASLAQGQIIVKTENIQQIVNALSNSEKAAAEAKPVDEIRDAFSFKDLPSDKPVKKRQGPVLNVPRGEPAFARKFTLTRQQWIFIGIMIAINVVILIGLVIFVWVSA